MASSNAFAAMAARVSAIVVGMILTPFVLHRLGRELYGVVIAVGSIYEYLSLLRGGIGGALRRYVTLHHHAGRHDLARRFYASGFWWGALLRTVILGIGLAVAPLAYEYFRLQGSYRHDCTIGVMLLFLASVISDQSNTFGITVYATGRMELLSIVQTLGGWARLGLTVIAFTLMVPSLKTFGGSVVATELLIVSALCVFAQRANVVGRVLPPLHFGDREVRTELFRYGGLAMLANAAALLYISADNLFIGRIYGASAVTRYSLGARWSPLVLGSLTALTAGLTPLFTSLEARGESARSRHALTRVVALTSALAVSTCLVPCVLGDLLLVRWVGPEYRGSFQYLLAMLLPATLDGALSPVWMALLARGRIGWVATGDIIVAVGNVGISLFLALVLHMDLLGFALGNTVALLAKNLLLRPLAARRDPTMPPMKDLLKPLPRALLGAAPGLLLLWLMRPIYGGSLLTVIVAGLLGGAVCLAGSLLTAVGVDELRRLLRLVRVPGMRRG